MRKAEPLYNVATSPSRRNRRSDRTIPMSATTLNNLAAVFISAQAAIEEAEPLSRARPRHPRERHSDRTIPTSA